MLHGPAAPRTPLILDSPHSGFAFPDDFGSALSEFDLREGEDCFVDELYLPATERGIGLIAACAPRTYIDPNRHQGDIDLALLEDGRWPGELVASGKARIGKALIWRTLDDGRAIYDRKLAVAEIERRIERFHRPYHRVLAERIDATHARFGASWHINCHSMNAVAGAQGEGGAGKARADFVVGDRDGTTCDSGIHRARPELLAGMGYDVRVNDPYKGVELVRAYSNPGARRKSLQLEINKRLYMDEATRNEERQLRRIAEDLLTLVDAVLAHTKGELARLSRDDQGRSRPAATRPQRVQLKRSAGWKMPANTVKVDRTTRWGNPFTAADCGSVAVAVAQHGRWMRGEIPRRAVPSRRRPRPSGPRSPVATSPAGARRTGRATPSCCSRSPTEAKASRSPARRVRLAARQRERRHRAAAGLVLRAWRGRGAGRRSPDERQAQAGALLRRAGRASE